MTQYSKHEIMLLWPWTSIKTVLFQYIVLYIGDNNRKFLWLLHFSVRFAADGILFEIHAAGVYDNMLNILASKYDLALILLI